MRHVPMHEFADATPLDVAIGAEIEPSTASVRPTGIAALAPALLLAACKPDEIVGVTQTGVRITNVAPPPSPTPTPIATAIPRLQAARLLGQATMGMNAADIARAQALGPAGWLDEQFAIPREIGHWDWLVSRGYLNNGRRDDYGLLDMTMWRQAITGRDQLRQRVGHALLDIFVVGIDGVGGFGKGMTTAAYVDLLMDNAFGNFRTLLEAIAGSAAMGMYLTFVNSYKANPSAGTQPDENFAREIMQLFTIGIYQTNLDGTLKLQSGKPIDTYTQADVSALARVWTGWTYAPGDLATPVPMMKPMVVDAQQHETGATTFLGKTIPAGATAFAARTIALDTLFQHPNCAPFFCKQLIQRLVTSNPSTSYIGRVAGVFENNGKGVRGDLRAVVRALLLDAEARGDASLTSATHGKLRTPIVRLTNWARAFSATSPSQEWGIGDTGSPSARLGQSPGRAPSVFNFFRPGYAPAGTPLAAQGLVAGELQLTTEPQVVGYINFMTQLIGWGVGDVRGNYSALLPLAANSQALIDEVNVLLAAGQLSAPTLTTIRGAVDSIAATTPNGQLNRVYAAILLVMASPEYLTQK